MTVYDRLIKAYQKKGAGYLVLIDPDKMPLSTIPSFAAAAQKSDVDALLVGGSLILSSDFERFVVELKKKVTHIPIIIFPGSLQQITAQADALLFLSVVSGRDAHNLIGNHVLAAPLVYRSKLETISTAYILIESGKTTAAQFMSGSFPLPRHKPELAVAHALAAQYLGFKFIYLEAGSGAEFPVPSELIGAVSQTCNLPVIVGGGIRTPQEARAKVEAGASFVVTGNIIEDTADLNLLNEFARAIHYKI
jgi:putative glycerol-1-phosphate prenyltransferase